MSSRYCEITRHWSIGAWRLTREIDMLRSRAASAARVVPVLVSLAPASSNNTVVALKVDQYIYRQVYVNNVTYTTTVLTVGRLQNVWCACLAIVWRVTGRCGLGLDGVY
jgi:hypothetical protein